MTYRILEYSSVQFVSLHTAVTNETLSEVPSSEYFCKYKETVQVVNSIDEDYNLEELYRVPEKLCT